MRGPSTSCGIEGSWCTISSAPVRARKWLTILAWHFSLRRNRRREFHWCRSCAALLRDARAQLTDSAPAGIRSGSVPNVMPKSFNVPLSADVCERLRMSADKNRTGWCLRDLSADARKKAAFGCTAAVCVCLRDKSHENMDWRLCLRCLRSGVLEVERVFSTLSADGGRKMLSVVLFYSPLFSAAAILLSR